MGYICAAKGCGNNTARQKDNIKFFRFPAVIKKKGEKVRKLSKDRRRQWLANIYRKDLNNEKANNTRVCSEHFVSGNARDMSLLLLLLFNIYQINMLQLQRLSIVIKIQI